MSATLPLTLFGETKEDLFFEISYEGPSFDGSMEIGDLGLEVAGLKDCLSSVVKALAKANRIDFGFYDIEILVEAFESGSFKKKIKFVQKVNKHCKDYKAIYASVSGVLTVLVNIMPIIIQHGPREINRMSPELIVNIADEVKINLLSDKVFKQSLVNLATPVRKEGDSIVLKNSEGVQKIKLDLEDADKIIGLKNEEESVVSTVFSGRISEMDLDALKNQIGFKLNGKGPAIACSFNQKSSEKPVEVKEYIPYLGKFVKLDGTATKKGNNINHIDINNISEEKFLKQETLSID